LVESLIHGFLLVADHPYREQLMRLPSPATAALRHAMDIVETAHLPLTTSTLARQCHVSVRTLQEGFRRHWACRRWHSAARLAVSTDLSADLFDSTVAAIAHRWGLTHSAGSQTRTNGVRRDTAALRCALTHNGAPV
jgi:AraC-like DNA-binding protein